jgi:hypothetical protein
VKSWRFFSVGDYGRSELYLGFKRYIERVLKCLGKQRIYLFSFHPIHEGDPRENLDMGKCFTTSIVSALKNVQRSRDS